MSVAYLILAHRSPAQVLRLVNVIRAQSDSPVIVHVDRKSRGEFQPAALRMAGLDRVRLVSELRVYWSDYSIVDALLHGLRVLLEAFPDVTHVKHLSGQDYPIRSLGNFEQRMRSHPCASIMDYERLPFSGWGEAGGLERIRYQHLRPGLAFGNRPLRLPIRKRLPPGIDFFGGSAFWCLSRSHAAFVLGHTRELQRFFRGTAFADEHFFHTALLNSPMRDEIVDEELTYTKWASGPTSPQVLTTDDHADLTRSGRFFARKFDVERDSLILDRLDHDQGLHC